jgi:hypothetical protein
MLPLFACLLVCFLKDLKIKKIIRFRTSGMAEGLLLMNWAPERQKTF